MSSFCESVSAYSWAVDTLASPQSIQSAELIFDFHDRVENETPRRDSSGGNGFLRNIFSIKKTRTPHSLSISYHGSDMWTVQREMVTLKDIEKAIHRAGLKMSNKEMYAVRNMLVSFGYIRNNGKLRQTVSTFGTFSCAGVSERLRRELFDMLRAIQEEQVFRFEDVPQFSSLESQDFKNFKKTVLYDDFIAINMEFAFGSREDTRRHLIEKAVAGYFLEGSGVNARFLFHEKGDMSKLACVYHYSDQDEYLQSEGLFVGKDYRGGTGVSQVMLEDFGLRMAQHAYDRTGEISADIVARHHVIGGAIGKKGFDAVLAEKYEFYTIAEIKEKLGMMSNESIMFHSVPVVKGIPIVSGGPVVEESGVFRPVDAHIETVIGVYRAA